MTASGRAIESSRAPSVKGSVRTISRAAFALGLALALGGCLAKRGDDVTGSIGAGASRDPVQARADLGPLARAYDAKPGDRGNALAYARALGLTGQRTQAVAVLQAAAYRNPKDTALRAAYGKALAEAGRLKEAADVLAEAHTPDRPDWRILSAQGAVADEMGDGTAAREFYEAALRIAPGEPTVMSNLGLSLALAQRLPEAEAKLREASAHPRADARVRNNLALVLALQGRFAESEALARRDLSPTEAAANVATVRAMVSQANQWNRLKAAPGAAPKAARAAPAAGAPPA